MSVATMSRFLQSLSSASVRRRRAVALMGATMSAGLIGLAASTAGVAGLAFALVVIAATAAAILWLRLREAERRIAALTAELVATTGTVADAPASAEPASGAAGPAMTTAPGSPLDAAERSGPAEDVVLAEASMDPAHGATDVPDTGEGRTVPVIPDPDIPERLPSFSLSALSGATVWDTDLAGRASVMVFWRPGCGHCQRLTPELAAWESLQGPRLIVVAACDGPTAYRAGLPGLVLLDPGFTVGQALGAPGTPAALPLGDDGQPTGPVVAGTTAVMTLLLDEMRAWGGGEIVTADADAVVPAMPASADGTDEAVANAMPAADAVAAETLVPAATGEAGAGMDRTVASTGAGHGAAMSDAPEESVTGSASAPAVADGAVSATPTSEPESIEAVVALRRVGSFAAGTGATTGDDGDVPVRRAG